jgi:hypothetical protein
MVELKVAGVLTSTLAGGVTVTVTGDAATTCV